MTVAEYIADFIEEKKMDFVFQYPGGMITHMIVILTLCLPYLLRAKSIRMS